MKYRRFWLTWNGGLIRLGCDGEIKPIVTLTNRLPDLNYVSFGALGERNPVEWRLECEFRTINILMFLSEIFLRDFKMYIIFFFVFLFLF